MRTIGLTGSIACGKSTVSTFLASRGFPVVDGDRLSRELTVPGSPLLDVLCQAFGPEFFYGDGSLNRRRLGQLVFSNPQARETLDRLMAPYLLSATQRKLDEIRSTGAALCFLDMPLLFEKGYDRLCDSVWTVWLPENLQLSRLMARDGYTQEEALSRIRSVLSSDEKAARADRVIDNSGTMEQTCSVVSVLLDKELALAGSSSRPRRSQAGSSGTLSGEPVRSSRDAVSSSPQRITVSPQAQGFPVNSAPQPMKMDRPAAAKKGNVTRKAAWRMPVWLKTSLIVFTALLLIGTTAFMLMSGYLRRCEENHLSEQAAIDRKYALVYRDLIEKYALEYNLSPAYVSAVIRNESSFRADAESPAGARGLMQLMPDTAEWIAHKLHVEGYAFERMLDPESNIRFGCWYLNYLSSLFLGDPVSVTAAYHAGQGQVKTWLSDPLLSEDGYSLSLSSLPEGPTKNYAGRVTRDYGIYQEKYFTPDLSGDDSDDHSAESAPGRSGLLHRAW